MSNKCTAVTFATILSATLLTASAPAQDKVDKSAIAPEIVRLSLVQGDVRVARGPKAEKASGSAWEKATLNLPLESGFSLVTGDGRAEIEFEDASTLYLAPNSAVTLNDLTAFNSVPSSTLTLLTGTATLNIRSTIPGERFELDTPVGHIDVAYPSNSIERVDSYLDAMAVTTYRVPPADPQNLSFPTHAVASTMIYRKGVRPIKDTTYDNHTFLTWDNWVAARIADRETAMTKVMHEAGLNVTLPGLDEMANQGSFFPCEPYGTCWQPAASWNGTPQQTTAAINAQAATARPYLRWEDLDDFPCMPISLSQLVSIDPVTHKRRILRTEFNDSPFPWDWTVCHTGSWIRYHHRYAWVVGRHRHHHQPVHWVKVNGRTGFVPVHPRDLKGKPPVNLKEGVFTVDHKRSVEIAAFKEGAAVKVLTDAPKFAREPELPTLARAESPTLVAHTADHLPGHAANAHLVATAVTSTITFNQHTQSFMLAQKYTANSGVHATVESFGGRIDHPNYASNSFREDMAAERTFESAQSRSAGAFSSGSREGASSSSFAGTNHGSGADGNSGGSFHGGGGGGSFSGGSSGGSFSHGSSGGGGSFSGGGGGGGFHGGGGSSGGSAPAPAPSGGGNNGGGGSTGSSSGGGGSHH